MQNLRDNDNVTSWIAAEAVQYLINRHTFSSKEFKTKLHKIIFLVAEEKKIPITRGWFKHGPFVFSNNVLNIDYDKNIRKWSSKSCDLDSIRSEIKEYSLNFDDILPCIEKWAVFTEGRSADEIELLIYQSLSPPEFHEIYLQKYFLSGVRTNISHLINYHNRRFSGRTGLTPLELLDKVYNDADNFENAAFNTFDDEFLEFNAINFFDIFNDLIWKLELVLRKTDLNKDITSTLELGKECFLKSVWDAYSGKIVDRTGKGVNKGNIKAMGKRTIKECIEGSPSIISQFNEIRKKRNLIMSYEDMKDYKNLNETKELDKKLWEIVKISSGYTGEV
jgi:hypothetical protein